MKKMKKIKTIEVLIEWDDLYMFIIVSVSLYIIFGTILYNIFIP